MKDTIRQHNESIARTLERMAKLSRASTAPVNFLGGVHRIGTPPYVECAGDPTTIAGLAEHMRDLAREITARLRAESIAAAAELAVTEAIAATGEGGDDGH